VLLKAGFTFLNIKANIQTMNKFIILAIGIILLFLISGCTSTGSGGTYESSCDREAEAHIETDRALEYCKTHPYGTYRGSVCGVPVNVVC